MPVLPDRVGGRVLIAALDRREIAEPDEPPAGFDRHVADVVLARELTGYP